MELPDRTFEAFIVDWDAAQPSRHDADVDGIRLKLEALSAAAADIFMVSQRNLPSLDGQLRVRPTGPGDLYVSVRGGSEVFKLDQSGAHRQWRLTDASDWASWCLEMLRRRGIGPGLVIFLGRKFHNVAGRSGPDRATLIPEAMQAFPALIDDQLARRAMKRTPAIDEDPGWTLAIPNGRPELERVHESLLTVADGRFGTRGAREEDGSGSNPLVVAGGVYRRTSSGLPALLPAPWWPDLDLQTDWSRNGRRILDLRTGVLLRELEAPTGAIRTARFSSLAQPGLVALRAEGPVEALSAKPEPAAVSLAADSGGVAFAGSTLSTTVGRLATVERLGYYLADSEHEPTVGAARGRQEQVMASGFDRALRQHRARWASRWADAEISIEGDPDAELAARFACFHLMSSVPDDGEAAVGARGLSGEAYLGHVFWDADVFVLPMLAATHPGSARAMLEYRRRRLEPACQAAATAGYRGARFPWESAGDGRDVTPRSRRDHDGRVVPVLTGDYEEHITSDVAWAAWHYAQWSGDDEFLNGPGRDLVIEPARYWATRVEFDAQGRAHLNRVEGPDEYHVPVDDNAFTNVMARWTLRRASDLVQRSWGDSEEASSWRRIADAIVDGYVERSGIYEQFAGFFALEPLIIAEIAQPPIAADVLLAPERLAGSQVVKQADVLMLHQLVPEEVLPGSLSSNLDYYGPRTAHGSSLSPAIQASLLARAGRSDEALALLRIALHIDLEDLTGTSAGGLHLATFGGVWQALAYGFLGLWPSAGRLQVDPRLPSAWKALEMTVLFQGRRVRIRAEQDQVWLSSSGPLTVNLPGAMSSTVKAEGSSFRRTANGWRTA